MHAAPAATYTAQAPAVTYAAPRSAITNEGKTVLQDNLTKYNEVNCKDKKLGEEHRSHRDVEARVPVWTECTVLVQWQGPPRISWSSKPRTSRSATMCSGRSTSHHDWTPSKWWTQRLCWSTERFTRLDGSIEEGC